MRTDSIISGKSSRNSYRVRSKTSECDEMLFGNPSKTKQEILQKTQQHGRGEQPKPLLSNAHKNKKQEIVRVITKDLIRDLIVPKKDPSGISIMLNRNDLIRIRESAKVKSQEEIELELAERQRIKDELIASASDRKQKFAEFDAVRKASDGLNDLEQEAKVENEHLLIKATMQRLEQEDDIKKLNELILNAKCHAIRDMQIVEKTQIGGDLENEEKRLDAIYEVHRLNGIKTAEQIEERKTKQRQEGARQILEQIRTNAENKLLEDEKKNSEANALVEYMDKLQDEDIAELVRKRDEQLAMQNEIDLINQQQQLQKEKRARQERIQDEKVSEYNRQKETREAAIEAEQEEQKAAKEREVNRLRAQQERAQDHKAEQDALRAKRHMEQNEREWRRKERDEAVKKANMDDEMRDARAQQMHRKLHFQAIQAQRERQEFERVLREQERENKRERVVKDKREASSIEHAARLRQQIKEREALKISERKNFFDESAKKESEEEEYRQTIEKVKESKLKELRLVGIPEKYITEVARRVNDPRR